MFLNPDTFGQDDAGLDRLEEIERASMRLVTQALVDFSEEAKKVFNSEPDDADAVAEDLTREALDLMGVSGKRIRVAGTIDYKRARLIFHPDYAVRQALLVDAKAEKEKEKARIQTSQTSLRIMRRGRDGTVVDEGGTLPRIAVMNNQPHVTTTVFVKFFYGDAAGRRSLKMIRLACLPNGMLQSRYNPTPDQTIWSAGRTRPNETRSFGYVSVSPC